MAPQMIGSAITPVTAQQPFGANWSQPTPMSGGGYGASGGGNGGNGSIIGNIGTIAGSMLNGSNGGAPANAAEIYAAQQGAGKGMIGNLSTAASLASLANKNGAFGASNQQSVGGALGVLGGGLQFIQGMQKGGVTGYGSAAVGGLRAASSIASLSGNSALGGTLGAAAGYIAAPLAVYSAIKNWQSGNTGSDTLQGAEAGAAVGSIIPGIGTVIGGVIGGAVGALSSAFGGGKTSQEATGDRNIDQTLASADNQQRAAAVASMSPPQAFQMIQGYMNAANNSAGHSEQIEQVFGKNGVNNMMGQMLPAINSAIQKDPSLSKLSAQDLYNQVAAPWLKSKGATIDPTTKDVKGNPEGQNLIDAITGFISAWQAGAVNGSTALGNGGETMSMPAYGSTSPASASSVTPTTAPSAMWAGSNISRALAQAA